jgi:hypothetical protein
MWTANGSCRSRPAFNKLDQQGELFLLAPSGAFNQIPFPAGTGGVREDRYESLLSYSRPLTGKLTMQLIAGGEYSTISVIGNNANSRTFVRPKGSFTLAWAPQAGLDVSLKLERAVGQLNFGDFLAAVNLNSNNQNDANNELRPDQSWLVEVEATQDFGAWGSATVRTFVRRFEDYITFIPTPGGGEARGNVEWARVMGLELTGTLRLDPLGLEGAKIDVSAVVRDSIYPDPVESGHLPCSRRSLTTSRSISATTCPTATGRSARATAIRASIPTTASPNSVSTTPSTRTAMSWSRTRTCSG